jgi:hypothetical protein
MSVLSADDWLTISSPSLLTRNMLLRLCMSAVRVYSFTAKAMEPVSSAWVWALALAVHDNVAYLAGPKHVESSELGISLIGLFL